MKRRAVAAAGAALLTVGSLGTVAVADPAPPAGVVAFADEDRSSSLTGEVPRQRYQFSSPTTVTYDRDTMTGAPSAARVYVADVGNHVVRVLDLDGRQVGALESDGASLDPASPHGSVPVITAPLGIAFLSKTEADDDRLAGLYVNDVGTHRIHFFRTDPANPDAFRYVTSIGQKGNGGGQDLTLPRNLTVLPQGLLYVSDEFNNRIKGFRLDPATWQASLVTTVGATDATGRHVGAGPVLPGEDKDWGTDSTSYDDYAGSPAKVSGFRIPQGQTWYRTGTRTFLYVTDNGNNRIKLFEVATNGTLTLLDILGRFTASGSVEHLKRPRGVRVDTQGNLFVADTYGGRILRFDNLAGSGVAPSYRTSKSADAVARWAYGKLGLHQVDMRTPATAGLEDESMQLPNDAVPLLRPDGTRVTEDVVAWGTFYDDAPVVLVSDTGNHRIKKCWEGPSGGTILRCSVSDGVGTATDHEFWGHPRELPGQLHYASALVELPAQGTQPATILVSDTPNSVIEQYSTDGARLGSFTGSQLMWGVTGLATFRTGAGGDDRRVAALVASDATLPWPYVADTSLRLYTGSGSLATTFNLTYRTGGRPQPAISFLDGNLPTAIDVVAETSSRLGVFVTTSSDHLWRFTYDRVNATLTTDWVAGGRDASKGQDHQTDWNYGPNFFGQGASGTFDQVQDVAAGGGRVYAVDRRNQRINVFRADTGAYVGRIGAGGGTYDHPDTITADKFFLPHGIDLDPASGKLLVGDGFNFVVRRYSSPAGLAPDASGQIRPAFEGYWLDPSLGTLDGGLFAPQHVLFSSTGRIFTDSLISNRVTRFTTASMTPAP
ncbi:hypothetical protein GCM10011376_23290 [Nocardioides flavus (ex Wang et al. 2016)]|uniref:NHL repeat-containing protein n=1 Tax=Nocardioides flavus (ex Wang et al. 2016) TaxID=2058780 RepID=A0ABQ3HNL4_9ACTN|nr:NHL repeat-containing protein [Nocardioides flavus (ex Wang et al. 2016)]GHE17719.1 hypothetical protein GCM10011376_23290 [Nocardioides flavus (ex Wang et al. 2016)]